MSAGSFSTSDDHNIDVTIEPEIIVNVDPTPVEIDNDVYLDSPEVNVSLPPMEVHLPPSDPPVINLEPVVNVDMGDVSVALEAIAEALASVAVAIENKECCDDRGDRCCCRRRGETPQPRPPSRRSST